MTTTTEAATILVVDDDPDCREIAALLLERAGYRTRRAASGEECMRIALAEPIDVVLLDVMMPGMDGFAVCEALRRAGKRIPKGLHREIKLFCVQQGLSVMEFVAAALEEKLRKSTVRAGRRSAGR